jgi:hypothetical protein
MSLEHGSSVEVRSEKLVCVPDVDHESLSQGKLAREEFGNPERM